MRDFDPELMDRDSFAYGRFRDFDSRVVDQMLHLITDLRDGEMSLLLLAGLMRDRMPWIAEVLVETHRELKTAGPEEASAIGHRLVRLVKETMRSSFGERTFGRNKSMHMLMMELPLLIDKAVSIKIGSRQFEENGDLNKVENREEGVGFVKS